MLAVAISANVLSFDFTTTNPCYPELGCRLQQPEQPALPLSTARGTYGCAFAFSGSTRSSS